MLVIMIQCAGVARACGPTLKLVRCALRMGQLGL